jgi:hypothetical protein
MGAQADHFADTRHLRASSRWGPRVTRACHSSPLRPPLPPERRHERNAKETNLLTASRTRVTISKSNLTKMMDRQFVLRLRRVTAACRRPLM